jgi:eukaryotic-like serine/threonine-protein kinase
MESDPPVLEPGTLLAGKLRIVRLLGAGGMGAVYEVEHLITKHRRALKLLHPQFVAYPHVIERFLREASAAGRIGNPHIIETFDAGQLESGEPYLVMELLEGQSLSDLMEKKGALSLTEAAELMRQACTGVQAAHDAGIVHRDLKPDNMFITQKDGRPFVKILDFGVSKFDPGLTGGLGMTQEGATLGTPYYMPPEQIRGDKHIDARADIYALGVILYECVAGNRPFNADTLAHLAVLIHEGNPLPLAQVRPDMPPRFVEVVHRAMAKDKDKRQASARELADQLATFTPQVLGPTVGWPGRGVAPPEPSKIPESAAKLKAKLSASASYGSGVSIPESVVPRRPLWPIAVAVLGAAIVGLVIFIMNRPAPKPSEGAGPVATAPVATTAVAAPPPGAPPANEALPEVPPAPSASASEAKGSTPKTLPPHPADKPPAHNDDAQKKSNSRVDQRGLAKDNPFK